jgi:carboxypeptidase D
VPYVEAYDNLFQLNDTYMDSIRKKSEECGYADFIEDHLHFPPKAKLPSAPETKGKKGCDSLWPDIKAAAQIVNPCFNMYSISTTCPLLWDVLGFPGSFEYLPEGATIYFNRTDVKKAINAPLDADWAECKDVPLEKDSSEASSFTVLPRVIEKSERTIISHGSLDFILLANGTLMSIQNMTWNGKQGFQQAPSDDLFVPYHKEYNPSTIAGSGIQGVTHTERGLTWNEVFLSGHMVPQYAPSVAYRQMEFLLGRIKSLTERSSFTTQQPVLQPQEETAISGNQPKQPGPKKQEPPKKQEGPKKQEPPKKPEGPKSLEPPKRQEPPKKPEGPKKQEGPKKPESPRAGEGRRQGQDDDDDDEDEDED